jgi:hypothetical protein
MYYNLGFACISLPPLVVFILEALELIGKLNIPVQVLAAIYPIGILTLDLYSLSYKKNSSIKHYLEFAKGARTGTFAVFAGSAVAIFFPAFFGEPLVGTSLLLISLGSIWLPSIAAAGALGSVLTKSNEAIIQSHGGTSHSGVALRFLSLFLGDSGSLKRAWRNSVLIIELLFFLVLGWVFLSIAGGFPLTLIGLTAAFLVPIISYRLFLKSIGPEDRSRIKEILESAEGWDSGRLS